MSDINDNQWYFDLVDDCAGESKNIDIDNGMAEHARYLIMKLFEVSNHTVQIYSGELARMKDMKCEVFSWGRLVASAVSFLNVRNGRIEILVENDIDGGSNNEFIKALKSSSCFKSNCEVRKVGSTKLDKHLVVSDGKGYRLEFDDTDNVVALANFNDPENARKYSSLFGSVFSKSKVIYV